MTIFDRNIDSSITVLEEFNLHNLIEVDSNYTYAYIIVHIVSMGKWAGIDARLPTRVV
jgi:hypothetical protein